MVVNYAKLAQSRRIAHCGGLFVYGTDTAVIVPYTLWTIRSRCVLSLRFLEYKWLTRHSI
jgi:hypothetical protein